MLGTDKSVLTDHLEKADTGGGEFQSPGAREWTDFQGQGLPSMVLHSPPLHFTCPPLRQVKRHGHEGDPYIPQVLLETSHFLNASQELVWGFKMTPSLTGKKQ